MGAPQLIDIKQALPLIAEYLRKEGLVIVPADKVRTEETVRAEHAELELLQQRLLKKRALTIKEVVDARLLGTTDKRTIQRWIAGNEKFREEETYPGKDGRGTIMILTSAIRRLAPHLP